MFLRQTMVLTISAIQLALSLFGFTGLLSACAHTVSPDSIKSTKPSATKVSQATESNIDLRVTTNLEPPPSSVRQLQNASEGFTLGLKFERERNYAAAAHAYRASLALDEEFHRSRINLGLVLTRLNQLDQANHQCQLVINAVPESALAWYCVGLVSFQKKNFAKAIESFSYSLQLRHPAPVVRLQLARCHFELGSMQLGLRELATTSSTARNRPDILLHVANEYENLRRLDEARATYKSLLGYAPNNYLAAIKLAKLYKKSSSPQLAGKYFQKALAIRPHSVSAVLAYLDWRLRSQLDLEPALNHLEQIKMIELRHKVKVAYYFWVDGQYEKALEYIRLALTKNPSTGQQMALEKLRQRIIRKENPRLSIPFYSTKPVTPKKRLPKSQIPEE